MIPKHSNLGALKPTDSVFDEAYSKAVNALRDAVEAFEAATGRTVDGIEIQWIDVTSLQDERERHIREMKLSWLPMPGERLF